MLSFAHIVHNSVLLQLKLLNTITSNSKPAHRQLHICPFVHLHICTICTPEDLHTRRFAHNQYTSRFAHTLAHHHICTPPAHQHICTHTCTPAQNYLIPGPAYPASAGDPLWPRIHSQINWETISSIVDGNHDSLDDDLIIRRWMALNLLRNDPQCWEWMLLLNIICS